ncbi:MAG: hydrogenase [Candidatus Bipolaricaulia bacterium]
MSGISSGFGTWNPIAWGLLVLGIAVLAFVLRATGRRDYKKGTDQARVFLSGNEEPENRGALHVRGSHLYWGMVDGLGAYYRRVQGLHTGVINDYVAWFVGALALLGILFVWVG